jgi:hypothetical protein
VILFRRGDRVHHGGMRLRVTGVNVKRCHVSCRPEWPWPRIERAHSWIEDRLWWLLGLVGL